MVNQIFTIDRLIKISSLLSRLLVYSKIYVVYLNDFQLTCRYFALQYLFKIRRKRWRGGPWNKMKFYHHNGRSFGSCHYLYSPEMNFFFFPFIFLLCFSPFSSYSKAANHEHLSSQAAFWNLLSELFMKRASLRWKPGPHWKWKRPWFIL